MRPVRKIRTDRSTPKSKLEKQASGVLAFEPEKKRPFAEFSEEVRQFLIDNDYSEQT